MIFLAFHAALAASPTPSLSRAAVLRGCCATCALGAAWRPLLSSAEPTLSELNTRLDDKGATKIFRAGLELAAQGSDAVTQLRDMVALRKAEDRFSLLIDELAPNFTGGYTNRANVRVAIGGDEELRGAIDDYSRALELAPEALDVWVTRLNRGSTRMAIGRKEEVPAPWVQRRHPNRNQLLGQCTPSATPAPAHSHAGAR
jgi:hypothetical protein